MSKLPVALQVYSVREDAERDFAGTMQKIKEMGYDGVELAGMYGHSPDTIKAAIHDAGLTALSAHVPFNMLEEDIEGTLGQYAAIGCQYIVIPYMTEDARPGGSNYDQTLVIVPTISEKCRQKGITLLYHNHDFEFITMPDGSFGLDHLYSHIPADQLQAELDTCWLRIAGQNPVAYIEKYAGRCPLVHLKDYYREGNAPHMYQLIGMDESQLAETEKGIFEFRPVGHGMQDFPAILAAVLRSDAQWVVVEQDFSTGCTPLQAVNMSREYLRSQGW